MMMMIIEERAGIGKRPEFIRLICERPLFNKSTGGWDANLMAKTQLRGSQASESQVVKEEQGILDCKRPVMDSTCCRATPTSQHSTLGPTFDYPPSHPTFYTNILGTPRNFPQSSYSKLLTISL